MLPWEWSSHSLKYRSQTVTGLAYLIAYATLALSPFTGFAIVATVPLSASLLFVAQRFEWTGISALGLAATYVLFVIRRSGASGATAESLAPYVALLVYWSTFEIADILSLRRADRASSSGANLFMLNFVGFLGGLVLQGPAGNRLLFSNEIAIASAAYLTSALARARFVKPSTASGGIAARRFGSTQIAVGLAAALAMWAIVLRFSGSQELLGLLLIAELLVVSGVAFEDEGIRLFGAIGSSVVVLRALTGETGIWDGRPWTHAWIVTLAIVTVVLYANREGLRVRRLRPSAIEWAYTPAASLLLIRLAFAELTSPYTMLALLALAVALTEAAIRRGAEYRYEAYVIASLGIAGLAVHQLGAPFILDASVRADTVARQAWRALLPSTVLTYVMAASLLRLGRSAAGVADARYAAGLFACAGTSLLALFEWRIAQPLHVAPYWAVTGVLLVAAGMWRRVPIMVVQGYVLATVAAIRAMEIVWGNMMVGESGSPVIAVVIVSTALMFVGIIGRRPPDEHPSELSDFETALRVLCLLAASTSIVLLLFHEVEPARLTIALALTGLLLIAGGISVSERILRLSGLVVFAIAVLRLFGRDLLLLEGLARIVSSSCPALRCWACHGRTRDSATSSQAPVVGGEWIAAAENENAPTPAMSDDPGGRRFATTRWSVVAAAVGRSAEADAALASLCESSWRPVSRYIHRTGASPR